MLFPQTDYRQLFFPAYAMQVDGKNSAVVIYNLNDIVLTSRKNDFCKCNLDNPVLCTRSW